MPARRLLAARVDLFPSTRTVGKGEAIVAAADTPLLMLNAPLVASRLGYPDLSGLDLLELYAFVHPARFVVPTPKGLATALGLPQPAGDADVPLLLQQAAQALLATAAAPDWPEREGAWSALQSLVKLRWPWATLLSGQIARPERPSAGCLRACPNGRRRASGPSRRKSRSTRGGGRAARHADRRRGGRPARPARFAREAAQMFAPRRAARAAAYRAGPGGHGHGQDAGLSGACLALDAAIGRHGLGFDLYQGAATPVAPRGTRAFAMPPPGSKAPPPVVVRKGRENYLCLLNLEDALQGGFTGRPAIMAQLVARWAAYSQDGDMIGGDLPGWLGTLFRKRGITALTDQRGECVYAGCPHYRKCFIERAARASAEAELVIANHALVMVNAARGATWPSGPRASSSTKATMCSMPPTARSAPN
jgi:ATP-dependent DNA helicase DinG